MASEIVWCAFLLTLQISVALSGNQSDDGNIEWGSIHKGEKAIETYSIQEKNSFTSNSGNETCGYNEVIVQCAKPKWCNTCGIRGNCKLPDCVEGCDCKPGYYRDGKGKCIEASMCPGTGEKAMSSIQEKNSITANSDIQSYDGYSYRYSRDGENALITFWIVFGFVMGGFIIISLILGCILICCRRNKSTLGFIISTNRVEQRGTEAQQPGTTNIQPYSQQIRQQFPPQYQPAVQTQHPVVQPGFQYSPVAQQISQQPSPKVVEFENPVSGQP